MDHEVVKDPHKISNSKLSPKLSSNSDESWKEILTIFFKDFMELAWPEIYREIDWNKGFEFFDKELQSLVKHEKKGKRLVDKLVRVWHHKMKEIFVILHIEIQDEKEAEFSSRMFIYNYRLRDRYRVPVVSLVVFIDKDKHWRPDIYQDSLWNCNIEFKYPIIKLIDFEAQREKLEKSDNPFAIVILCQLSALNSKYNADLRFSLKYTLSKTLLKKKWDRDKIIAILKFLDGILRLPDQMESEFLDELKREVEEELDMSYVTSFEYFAELRGIEKGIEEGIEKGIQKGECRLLLSLLQEKFKTIPEERMVHIQNANSDILLTWASRVLSAQTIEEVFA